MREQGEGGREEEGEKKSGERREQERDAGVPPGGFNSAFFSFLQPLVFAPFFFSFLFPSRSAHAISRRRGDDIRAHTIRDGRRGSSDGGAIRKQVRARGARAQPSIALPDYHLEQKMPTNGETRLFSACVCAADGVRTWRKTEARARACARESFNLFARPDALLWERYCARLRERKRNEKTTVTRDEPHPAFAC